MRHHIPRWSWRLAAAALVLAGCSTAKQGNAAEESASAPVDAAAQARPARAETIAPTRPIVRPETLPSSDPSLRRDMPVVSGTAADTASERATIARLERQARAIAKTTGCKSAAACRTAPVGAKACGGPRTYLVYCATSTDTVALMRTLRELERVERAYNEHSGIMSTCEMRLPPATALVGGSCREAPSAGPAGTVRLP